MTYKPVQTFKQGQDADWDSNEHFMGNVDPFNLSGWNSGGSGDYSGMAQMPTYIGMSPNGLAISGKDPAMNKFSEGALRNGPSIGTSIALKQNTLGANAQREQARKMAAGQAANTRASIAMTGGLGSGASERAGRAAGNSALDFSNAADANASNGRANLMIADEGARMGNLAQAGQMNQATAAGDLQRQQGEYDRRNAFNSNIYNQQMKAWGAGKQADATANSGKK